MKLLVRAAAPVVICLLSACGDVSQLQTHRSCSSSGAVAGWAVALGTLAIFARRRRMASGSSARNG